MTAVGNRVMVDIYSPTRTQRCGAWVWLLAQQVWNLPGDTDREAEWLRWIGWLMIDSGDGVRFRFG